MRTLECLSAIAFTAATISGAQARQVQIYTFAPQISEFRLLEPGHLPKPYEPATDTTSPPRRQLASALEALAQKASTVPGPSPVASANVPSWMKGSLFPMDRAEPLASNLSVTPCGPIPYAPHPALNATQELRRQRYFGQMAAAACGAGVPVHLFDALIIQESRYNPLAISSKGASGLTQLMPGTATSLGVLNRWNVAQNLDGGARYLRKQLDTFGNWALALGAYNAGPGNLIKYGGLPPFRETRGYVRAILSSVSPFQYTQRTGKAMTPQAGRSVALASFSR